ncbi:hypothetical protein [Celeribacter sp. PS-C1]|uniref:hypothetical protein n=1 Tax=Celeribacter sp. PS-C1 TaxID=2820813 RepID=UPI001CA49CC9|nr:hypothetical protein [Celeribacter sp. PS-C1]MBW6419293.1 hypothetical protein [Celeribacter sp. PS-C1]
MSVAYFVASGLSLIVIARVFYEPAAVVSYERDIWHHLSVFRELIASPFHAANPHVDTMDPSRSYTPWSILVAIITRSFGGDEFDAMRVSALGAIAVILGGIQVFARQYWKTPVAPLVLLVAIFGTWIEQVDHTGYTTIRTTLFSVAYPYAPVIGLSFWTWWVALKSLRGSVRLPVHMFALATLTFIMLISHQLQGLFGIGMTGAFLLFAPGEATWRHRFLLSASVFIGLLLTQVWIYGNPIAYVLNENVRHGHDAVRFLSYDFSYATKILWVLGLGLVGILGFFDWHRRRLRLELFLPFLVVGTGFVVLTYVESWVNVRVLPFVAIILQLGLVSAILTPSSKRYVTIFKNGILIILLGTLIYGILYGTHKYNRARTFLETGEVSRQPKTWSATILKATAFAETLVPRDSVAIAHLQTAFPIEASSLSVVAIPRLFAEVPDMAERKDANTTFFDHGISVETRCAILKKYDVRLIVWRDVWLEPDISNDLALFGNVRAYNDLRFIAAEENEFAICGQDGNHDNM